MPGKTSDQAADDERVRQTAASYGEAAEAYKRCWAPVLLPLTALLLDHLPLANARLVADIGSGVGASIPEIRARAPSASIICVDRSIGMLRLAPETQLLVVMDATRLSLSENVVDVAIVAFMLFHVPDPVAALREIRRVLRPGGWIGITTWGTEVDVPAWNVWSEELDAHGASPGQGSQVSTGELMDTPEKLRALLEGAGLSSVSVMARPLGNRPDLDTFLELHTRFSAHERLQSLSPRQRATCIERATARLRTLKVKDFEDRSEVLLATARA